MSVREITGTIFQIDQSEVTLELIAAQNSYRSYNQEDDCFCDCLSELISCIGSVVFEIFECLGEIFAECICSLCEIDQQSGRQGQFSRFSERLPSDDERRAFSFDREEGDFESFPNFFSGQTFPFGVQSDFGGSSGLFSNLDRDYPFSFRPQHNDFAPTSQSIHEEFERTFGPSYRSNSRSGGFSSSRTGPLNEDRFSIKRSFEKELNSWKKLDLEGISFPAKVIGVIQIIPSNSEEPISFEFAIDCKNKEEAAAQLKTQSDLLMQKAQSCLQDNNQGIKDSYEMNMKLAIFSKSADGKIEILEKNRSKNKTEEKVANEHCYTVEDFEEFKKFLTSTPLLKSFSAETIFTEGANHVQSHMNDVD
jgi:hypothetical protein